MADKAISLEQFKNALKAIRNSTISEPDLSVRFVENAPNWNAAEGEAGHIKNRPFKKEFVKLFEKKEVTFDSLEELGGMGIAHVSSEVTAYKFDTRYKVIFNGVEYYNKTVNEFGGNPYPTIGNPLFDGGDDNGQPYLLMATPEEILPGYGIGLYCIIIQPLEKCEIEIFEEIITPLDITYMPESYVLDATHTLDGGEFILEEIISDAQMIELDKEAVYEFCKNTKRGIVRIKTNYRARTYDSHATMLVTAQHCYDKIDGTPLYKIPINISRNKTGCVEYVLEINVSNGMLRFTKMV